MAFLCTSRDRLPLRYGWTAAKQPMKCACGCSFSVEHVLSCAKGAFPTIRHNEICNLTAHLLTEVCNNVPIEPDLQPITPEQLAGATANSQDSARLDLSANEVWSGSFKKTSFDVRVFNPHAPSNKTLPLPACYRTYESEKKCAYMYEQQVREVEHSSFTSLVFSATRGMGVEATNFCKHLASMLTLKRDPPYSSTLVLTKMPSSILTAPLCHQAIRGARSSQGHAVRSPASIDLVNTNDKTYFLLLLLIYIYICIYYIIIRRCSTFCQKKKRNCSATFVYMLCKRNTILD